MYFLFTKNVELNYFLRYLADFFSEAAIQRCSYEKVFWKYIANLQENIHTEVRFQ